MSGTLTRRKLYDLVWSKPRTTLAREMGVSDVWIGKQCRALNVPAPPPGHWASLAAGGKPKAKYLRPPLTYTVAERMQEDHGNAAAGLEGFDARDLAQPLPAAPVLSESVEEAVARYAGLARAQGVSRRPEGRHPVVLRLLAEDEQRAAEAAPYSWRQPLYGGPQGEAILQFLDRLALHWTDRGFGVGASRGRDVELFVSCGSQSCRFEVDAAPVEKTEGRRGRPRSRAMLQFWLDRERDSRRPAGKPALVFSAMDAGTIDTLTVLLITQWEREFRDGLQWRHKRAFECREWVIRAAEEAARREREKREAEARALSERRHRLLVRAVDRIRRADEIRGLVAAMEATLSGHGEADGAFERWKAWALEQADAMDLRVQPAQELVQWIGGFALEAGGAG